MINDIQRIIKTSTLEKLFNDEHISNIDWIWVNKETFKDILYNLELGIDDDDIQKEIDGIEDKEIFNILNPIFENNGFIKVNQYLFSIWEEGYKPTDDIETIVYVKNKLYRQISIDIQIKYNWILKAIAVDTYLKIVDNYENFKECYKDLYEDNYRIIEDLLSRKKYLYLLASWEFRNNIVYFYKQNKLINTWREKEIESYFDELINKI